MALTLFSPAIARSREVVVDKTKVAVLSIVPELKTEDGEKVSSRAFGMVLSVVAVLGMLTLLFINTLLTQDAFVLQRLKHEVNQTNDQRDAILREVARRSTPTNLSEEAIRMGMKPGDSPRFIDISGSQAPVGTPTP